MLAGEVYMSKKDISKKDKTKNAEQEMQRKYMEYQILQQHAKQFQEQLEKFETQLVELHNVKQHLDDLNAAKKGTELLVPLTNGIFVKASLQETDNLIVNVGSSVAVKKTISETKQLLQNQIVEIESYKAKLLENLTMLMSQAQRIEKELSVFAEQMS